MQKMAFSRRPMYKKWHIQYSPYNNYIFEFPKQKYDTSPLNILKDIALDALVLYECFQSLVYFTI